MITAPVQETVLTGDIGGTNARFVLFENGALQAASQRVVPVAKYTDLGDAIADYLVSVGDARPVMASFSFASTHEYQDRMELTNSSLSLSVADLQKRFALRRARVVNDFTAAAVGITSLPAENLQCLHGGSGEMFGPKAVLGPGTGLGVSGLVHTGNYWLPLQSQGGHVSMAAQNSRELALYNELAKRFKHVSAERYLSGPGTVNIYSALCAIDNTPVQYEKASEITSAAIAGSCDTCTETMQIFCKWLGIVAGNLAVTLGATGGIYLVGGILPKLEDYFLQSGFIEALHHKGRFTEFVKQMPVWLVTGGDPALYGSYTCLQSHYNGFGYTVDA